MAGALPLSNQLESAPERFERNGFTAGVDEVPRRVVDGDVQTWSGQRLDAFIDQPCEEAGIDHELAEFRIEGRGRFGRDRLVA